MRQNDLFILVGDVAQDFNRQSPVREACAQLRNDAGRTTAALTQIRNSVDYLENRHASFANLMEKRNGLSNLAVLKRQS
jgi:hypothetical protein